MSRRLAWLAALALIAGAGSLAALREERVTVHLPSIVEARACLESLAEQIAEAEPGGEGEARGSGEAREAGEAGEAGESEAAEEGPCELRRHPESFAELSAVARGIEVRIRPDSIADQVHAARLRQRLLSRPPRVPGTNGRWTPVGKGPLHADDPNYPDTYGGGYADLSGRITDYTYDKRRDRLYAAVSSGGVWVSTDKGRHWRSVGDSLPTQATGAIAYSPAAGGSLIVVSGDNAFGGNTYGGLGVYRSTDGGRTWRRSSGVPNGVQGFAAAVDQRHPKIVYAATGAGLFRSVDAGRSFRNVNLPTGARCQGTTFMRPNCFFANVVTDVVVQAPDRFGHRGGTVLAAVGWREGSRENFNGVPQAPGNGLYRSASGKPGSFQRVDVSNGFAAQNRIGRVALGAASGPGQNHGFVYALVQDAVLFGKGTVEGLDVPNAEVAGLQPLATPTYLNGIYVSPDFGLHWRLMAGRQQMLLPTTGSVLAQLTPFGFGPGIQAWFNAWIKPDPTVQTGDGTPTRVVFGLEELYANRFPIAQDGLSDFEAIGPYNANGGPCLLVLATEACSAINQISPQTTTHPDHHGGIFIPDGRGGVTLVAGGDGGNYTQHVAAGQRFTQRGFGKGDQLGLHTLLVYGVAGARDGVVYAGLQDNGEIRISAGGRQNMTFGGDGIFTQVDPDNSDIAYEELPNAGVNVTTDGGRSWRSIDPFLFNPSFYAPLVMDPTNANHLLVAGRDIAETTSGPRTTSPADNLLGAPTDWKYVYDLGDSPRGVENQASAIGVRGPNVYVGYCGSCDVVREHVRFSSGIATNVGGSESPQPGTGNGWHKVPARGLPQRFISSITIDPRNPRTLYVTLGASDLRPYAPPGALGADGLARRGGHIYKSTDAGRSFHDISGNLARVPALWSVLRGRQLIVGTTAGVFASRRANGGPYAPLGRNLPAVTVFNMQLVPGHPRQLLVGTLGRGVYRYTFPR